MKLHRPCLVLQWEGHWSQTLLDSLYRITAKQSDRQAHEVWPCLAAVWEMGRAAGACTPAHLLLAHRGPGGLVDRRLCLRGACFGWFPAERCSCGCTWSALTRGTLLSSPASTPASPAAPVGHPGRQPPQHRACPQLSDRQRAEGGCRQGGRRRARGHRQGGAEGQRGGLWERKAGWVAGLQACGRHARPCLAYPIYPAHTACPARATDMCCPRVLPLYCR